MKQNNEKIPNVTALPRSLTTIMNVFKTIKEREKEKTTIKELAQDCISLGINSAAMNQGKQPKPKVNPMM